MVTEDRRRGRDRRALLRMVYESWQGPEHKSSWRTSSASVDELRQSPNYAIVTPEGCVELVQRNGVAVLHPLVAGIDPKIGWTSLPREMFPVTACSVKTTDPVAAALAWTVTLPSGGPAKVRVGSFHIFPSAPWRAASPALPRWPAPCPGRHRVAPGDLRGDVGAGCSSSNRRPR
jgi:hypothetical protein